LKLRIVPLLICCVISTNGWTQSVGLITRNTVKARSLGMGGAFLAMEDDIASVDLNPATVKTYAQSGRTQVSVYFNPLGPVMVLKNWNGKKDWDVPVSWVLRGASITTGRINIGLLLGEECISINEGSNNLGFFDGSGFTHRRNSSIGFSLALSPLVSVGIAGELFIREVDSKRIIELGYRYGVMIRTRSRINVGLCFVDLPNNFKEDRLALERLADETLNVGVSYMPWSFLILSLDVRNVSDDGKGAVREPHIGFEVLPIKHLAVRGGYYREKGGRQEALSLGLGLFDWNSLLSEGRRFSHASFGLNGAYIWQWNDGIESRWFVLSSVVRF
jgi:hypothetical protein